MKRLFLVFSIITILIPNLFSAKPIIPPGTVKINDSLYFDKTEVRNVDYIEFVYWTQKEYGEESEEYLSVLPDTLVWKVNYSEPMRSLYFRHPAYKNYPIVGVSYDQAVTYCNWRTDRVNEMLYIKINKIPYDSIKNLTDIPKYVEYRLPTESEWESVANLPYSEKTLKHLGKKKHIGIPRNNLNRSDDIGMPADFAGISAPVASYWPNCIGVYNMIGNVGELTSIKGKAKGGSWQHIPEEVNVEAVFEYEQAESWLGFRCICDMHIQI